MTTMTAQQKTKTKLMYVVPPDYIRMLVRNQQQERDILASPQVKRLLELDRKMHDLLFNRPDLSTQQKHLLYSNLLKHFIRLQEKRWRESMGSPAQPPLLGVSTYDGDDEDQQMLELAETSSPYFSGDDVASPLFGGDTDLSSTPVAPPPPPVTTMVKTPVNITQLIAQFPPRLQTKSKGILKTLTENPNFNFDATTGNVYINQQLIPNSNLSDILRKLIHPATASFRKTVEPAGFDEVLQLLSETDLSAHTLGNQQAQIRISAYKSQQPPPAPAALTAWQDMPTAKRKK